MRDVYITVCTVTEARLTGRYFRGIASADYGAGAGPTGQLSTALSDTAKSRKPNFASRAATPSGRVTHDDRGNAVWQWGQDREELQGNLSHLDLSVTEDAPTPDAKTKVNKEAAKVGYNPYQSDLIKKDARGKRSDLQALSRQIEAQRKRDKDPAS